MTSSAQTAAHLSIDLAAEGLAVLAAELGHDPGRLGVALPTDRTRREREAALAAAGRSLRVRRIIGETEGGRQMAEAVARIVDIVCQPVVRVDVYLPARIRFRAQPDGTVRVERRDGQYRLTPFATADLVRWIAADTGLGDQPAGRGAAIELPAESYLRLRRAMREGQPDRIDRVVSALERAVPPELLDAMTGPPGRERALSVRRRAGRRLVGAELAWIDAGAIGLWELPTIDQPMAGADRFGGLGGDRFGGDGGDRLGDERIVRIAPSTPRAIVEALIGSLRDEGTDGASAG